MTWKDIAVRFPQFVQWVTQRHGPLPDGEVKQEDYERYKMEWEEEV